MYRDGADRQQILELSAAHSPLSIGRQPASDIALTWDDEVSRAHADVECIGDVWTLVDDGRSRNGSYVGGERVHGRRALRDGDVIAVGRTTLTYIGAAREPRWEHGRRRARPGAAAQRRPAPRARRAVPAARRRPVRDAAV